MRVEGGLVLKRSGHYQIVDSVVVCDINLSE